MQTSLLGLWFAHLLCASVIAAPAGRPSWTEVEKTVALVLARTLEYQPGDLIARSEVAAVLTTLGEVGFAVPQRDELLGHVADDSEPLVTLLRTKRGRPFMRKVAGIPLGYDRVDRLLRIPDGKKLVSDLIRGPGGDELIRYLATTDGGKNMGKQLGGVARGKKFNEPTGRIYTEKQLVAVLRAFYYAPPAPPADKPR